MVVRGARPEVTPVVVKVPPQAPRLDQTKVIDYDFQKYGSSAERKRLLSKWDKEVKALPK